MYISHAVGVQNVGPNHVISLAYWNDQRSLPENENKKPDCARLRATHSCSGLIVARSALGEPYRDLGNIFSPITARCSYLTLPTEREIKSTG